MILFMSEILSFSMYIRATQLTQTTKCTKVLKYTFFKIFYNKISQLESTSEVLMFEVFLIIYLVLLKKREKGS